MNKALKFFTLGLALTVSGVAVAAEYQPGEIIVKYKENLVRTRSSMGMLYHAAGVKKVRHFGAMMNGFERLILADNVKVEDAIQALQQSGAVEYAVPNLKVAAFPTTQDAPGGMPGIPCIPGIDIPGCDPNACIIPGIFPPGCKGDSGGGGGGTNPPDNGGGTTPPDNGGNTPASRPDIQPAPAEPAAAADPDLAKAYGLSKIGATEAWKIFPGDKKMVVAVLDTGIDYNHEDLAYNLWRNPAPDAAKKDVIGWDVVHNDGLPWDDLNVQGVTGHGSHASGTVGAVGNNGKGVSGVAQRVSLMPVKFLNSEGGGNLADSITAIDYAVSHGAKVLSNSWGVTASQSEENGAELKPIKEAIERAGKAGVLTVFAAGNGDMFGKGLDNDGDQRAYPAAFKEDNLIAVAATDEQDRMTTFSNFGKNSVHLAAPGANIYSTIPGSKKYTTMSGTSMACPHVAGAAALVWAKRPDWNYQQVKQALISSVDKVADEKVSTKTISGGRLNVLKALRATE